MLEMARKYAEYIIMPDVLRDPHRRLECKRQIIGRPRSPPQLETWPVASQRAAGWRKGEKRVREGEVGRVALGDDAPVAQDVRILRLEDLAAVAAEHAGARRLVERIVQLVLLQ